MKKAIVVKIIPDQEITSGVSQGSDLGLPINELLSVGIVVDV